MSTNRYIKTTTADWARQSVHSPDQALGLMKQIEEIKARLVTNLDHSVEAYTPAGDAIYVNAGWQNLWGMDPSVMKGYNILQDKNLHTKVTWHAIKAGFSGTAGCTPEAHFTPEEIGMPGRERWTDGFISPVFNSDNELASVLLHLRDITNMKVALSEITELRNKIQALQFQYEAITERLDAVTGVGAGDAASQRLQGLPKKAELTERAALLSPREKEIFALLAADKPVKEIAYDLQLGSKSVYTYRVRLMTKLGLGSDIQIAAAWRELNGES